MTETHPAPHNDPASESITTLLRPLWRQRAVIVLATAAAGALALLGSLVHYWAQPTRWTAYLEFRPTFSGAGAGKYPNGLPFGPSDVIDPSIIDQVYDGAKVQDYCDRDDFRSAFYIEQRSSELQVIDFDYQSRLADTRLTAVERQRLLDEYQARRAAAQVQYGVTFTRPPTCSKLPPELVVKMLDDVLRRWANESELKRGVLKQRVKILTPYVLDVGGAGAHSLFVRANLLWINIDRIVRNITEVETMPGAELVRVGEQRASLAEIRARMLDLQRVSLEPLMPRLATADSARWVQGALATASSQLQVAQSRARANLDALREYSGVSQQTAPPRDGRVPSTDVQSLSPQIDRTFIDRIVEMSAANTLFRQELTRETVKSSLEAVEFESAVDHYKQLLESLRGAGQGGGADESANLTEVVNEAKELTRQFDALYDEWSKVSLRAGPAMYRTEKPAAIDVLRPVRLSSYASVVVLVMVFVFILALLSVLVYARVAPVLVGPSLTGRRTGQ